ncbi:sulfite exporter TauE/SafE family protein [Pseudogemmobacter sonorensis]|uniref:sulfite exporter TauE/SafE family protein n=1 Tax=Pseudogemmobacter sonorensis TaxID=2989681 RepID=UPI0036ADD9E7
METPEFWTAAVVAAICVGIGKGGIPLVGMLGVPVFALVISPVVAAGILLPVFVISDMFGLWAYRHALDRRVLAILLPGAVVGVAFGWATAHVVPEAAVTALVGGIGVSFALYTLLRPGGAGAARPARVGPGLFWGTLAGFTSFVSHSGAPLYQIYTLPLRLEKTVFAGTATVFFAVINVVKLLPYWQLGQFSPGNLKLAFVLAVPAAMAVFAGVALVRRLPERLFFRLVVWALLLVSLKLLRDGAAGLGLI